MYVICSMLTKKQKNLLLFINKKIRSTGVSPSYEEMKNSLNLKSKSGIHRLISALEERGFIKRLAHKARALEVLKLPETASANDIYNSFSPSVIRGGLDSENNKKRSVHDIPVLGKILVGSKSGEGVFGVSFKIKGPPKDLQTTVNPIKTLTPRFITRTLEKIKKN